jgi:hypothetical protein
MKIRSLVLISIAALALPLAGQAATPDDGAAPAVSANAAPAVAVPAPGMNRYMVVRTFPAGALAGLDAAAERAVNRTNATYSVSWIHSYANAEKTKTFCIYEGPSEQAIRDAAVANKIPVDYIVEIPVVLGAR